MAEKIQLTAEVFIDTGKDFRPEDSLTVPYTCSLGEMVTLDFDLSVFEHSCGFRFDPLLEDSSMVRLEEIALTYEDGETKEIEFSRIKTNSDVDSMKEVIYRRYFRLVKNAERLPDGILVDGGLTQINAAKEILDALDLSDKIRLMGLVKDDHHNTSALMDTDGTTMDIEKDSSLFFLLTRMQDEVHRVAITYHRKLRAKAQTRSILDEIEGIGPKRKRLLLQKFGTFGALKEADVSAIAQYVPMDVAQRVYDALHEEK